MKILSNEELKKLKNQRKEIIKDIEILERKMRRGLISANEYFQEFDNKKNILTKIKQRIQQLELGKVHGIKLNNEIELQTENNNQLINSKEILDKKEIEKGLTFSEKIKSHITKGLKSRMELNSAEVELNKTADMEKLKDNKQTFDLEALRKLKFFQEKRLTSEEHPNFIHLKLRNILEELGYKIIKLIKPLPESIELEQVKFKVFDFIGYLTGNKTSSTNSEETISIIIQQEGICSIVFDGQRVTIQTRAQISMAGNSSPANEKELEKDINIVSEKLSIF